MAEEETLIDYKRQKALTKKAVRRVAKKRSGIDWTTTQAFNIIMHKQISIICEHFSHEIDIDLAKTLTKSLWLYYLKKSELAFHDKDKYSSEDQTFPLHPNSRFRDIQILKHRVESLPEFRNAMTGKARADTNVYKMGPDGLMRSIYDNKLFDFKEFKPDKDSIDFDDYFDDYFTDSYRDPRIYIKNRFREKKTEEMILNSLKDIDLEFPAKTCDEHHDQKSNSSTSLSRCSSEGQMDVNLTEIADKNDANDDEMNGADYEQDLMKNAPEFTREMVYKRGSNKCKRNAVNHYNRYFDQLMTLPKTMAILNIVFRLMKSDIYLFDLIRWADERHIPFKYCFSVLPQEWLFISNDFNTFATERPPSADNLSFLSVQMIQYLGVTRIPPPNLTKLLDRFAKDLNLPKDIVWLIDSEYNLMDFFGKDLEPLWKEGCGRFRIKMPVFERWALMAIVLVLKRLFESAGKLFDSTRDDENDNETEEMDKMKVSLFDWKLWLRYSQLRLDLIESYCPPSPYRSVVH